MTYNEIYNILSFGKTKLITTKLFMSSQNNLITVIGSAKQHRAQIQIWTKASKGALLGSGGTTNIILVSSCKSIVNNLSTFFSLAKIHIKSLKFWKWSEFGIV